MQAILNTAYGELTIRPFQVKDIDSQMDYLYDSSNDFLESIGFDTNKFPGRKIHKKRMVEKLESRDKLPFNEQQHFVVVAQLEQKVMAMVVLNPDEDSTSAHAHFHIWDESLRGKGLGAQILKSGLKLLMIHQNRNFALIEPHRENKRMNRLMEKCGFEYMEECIFSGPVTQDFPAKRYK